MYPGRFDEQPIPLMVSTSWGWRPSSAMACLRAASTPKSPQPGHQSGSTLPLNSLTVSFGRGRARSTGPRAGALVSTAVSMAITLDVHFVHGHVLGGLAGQDGLDPIRDVMGHERLPVVLADVAVGREAGLRSE